MGKIVFIIFVSLTTAVGFTSAYKEAVTEIAYLVNAMVKNSGVLAANVHLIGHSLGSHISGYAGEKIKNLGRITVLDPAGPFFTDMDPIVRLDPSDASFVNNIHTGAAFEGVGPGTLQQMGHVDIYANGGQVQPGCDINVSSSLPFYELAKVRTRWICKSAPAEVDTLDCSHGRSLEIFRDSLISTCQAVAYECTDYNTFQQGKCYSCGTDNTHCAPSSRIAIVSLSYHRTRTNIQLYYTTSDTTPFCQYQYAVQISVSSKIWSAPKEVYGVVSVSVNSGAANFNLIAVPNTDTTFQQGQQKTLLMTSSVNMGKISSLTLFWTPTSGILNNIYCYFYDCNLYVANVTISSLNQYPEAERLPNTFNGCPASSTKYTTIAPKSYAFFNVKNGSLSCN